MVIEAENKYLVSERLLAHCFLLAIFWDENQNCEGREEFLRQIKPHIKRVANSAGFFLTRLTGTLGNTKRAQQLNEYYREIIEGNPNAFNY